MGINSTSNNDELVKIREISKELLKGVNESVICLVDHKFTIDKKIYGEVFRTARELKIFENAQIDSDGAIDDLIEALNKGCFILVAKLAEGNECSNIGNNSFIAYVEVLNLFGLKVSENYLRGLT